MSGHRLISTQPNTFFYGATKFAVTALTEGIRQELREMKSNVKVTVSWVLHRRIHVTSTTSVCLNDWVIMTTESAAKMALNSHHCNCSILWQKETIQIQSWEISYNRDSWHDYYQGIRNMTSLPGMQEWYDYDLTYLDSINNTITTGKTSNLWGRIVNEKKRLLPPRIKPRPNPKHRISYTSRQTCSLSEKNCLERGKQPWILNPIPTQTQTQALKMRTVYHG